MEASDSALEQFRRQWKEEVNSRSKGPPRRAPRATEASLSKLSNAQAGSSVATRSGKPSEVDEAVTQRLNHAGKGVLDLDGRLDRLTLRAEEQDDFFVASGKEPESALEHFEKAIEKEGQGSLGESLSYYRKAYRLDASVDQTYRQKHFPPPKPGNPNPSNAPATVPSTAHHSSKEPPGPESLSALIVTFAELPISPAAPIIEGDRPPPCPISRLPSEILTEILLFEAIRDPASFVRLASVCKRLAYHVFTENQIWKRVALGSEFGLKSQIYDFRTDLHGREAFSRTLSSPTPSPSVIKEAGLEQLAKQDWREVFHSHPRIRFSGVYISTVNYPRPGGASVTQATWNAPVHIVTYYRYLRFFRDGTVISLQTTSEPIEVVQHLNKENMAFVRGGKDHHPLNFTSSTPITNPPPTQPTSVSAGHLMKHALRGRWRLCQPLLGDNTIEGDIPGAGPGDQGDVYIETEGAGPRYLYTMQLTLKSSSKSKQSVKNNKLQWKSFWSYNQLTNDWDPFQLKNDRAFLFSRVRSYGLGY